MPKRKETRGRKPASNPRERRVNVRVDVDLYDRIEQAAEQDGRSISSWGERVMRAALEGDPAYHGIASRLPQQNDRAAKKLS